MKRIIFLLFCGLVMFSQSARAQWQPQVSGTSADFRGLSAVGRNIVWVGGSKGTFVRTIDGGLHWETGFVPDASDLDFRDVQAVDANTAYLLSAGPAEKGQAKIYKTTDGGKHWTLQYTNNTPGVFFDAFAFWDADHGVAVSDPVSGHFLIITTADGGATWREVPRENIPPALAGEGAFAASGTCLIAQGKGSAWFGTGGAAQARVFRSTDGGRTWTVSTVPAAAGESSAGIFSLAFRDARHGIAVGGDYKKPESTTGNVAITDDGGKTWRLSKGQLPGGFRSCVVYIPGSASKLVAVGTTGSDLSVDGGENWVSLGKEDYNAVSFSTGTGVAWAAGPKGGLAKYVDCCSTSKR
jgi:photosystem II stability/assembly factor-like uncharacterized protein